MSDRVLTRHPDPGKNGVRIDRDKYEMMRTAILSTLDEQGETTFANLTAAIREQLVGRFDGSVSWYFTTVKLDLEARNLIARVQRSRPQLIQLVRKSV